MHDSSQELSLHCVCVQHCRKHQNMISACQCVHCPRPPIQQGLDSSWWLSWRSHLQRMDLLGAGECFILKAGVSPPLKQLLLFATAALVFLLLFCWLWSEPWVCTGRVSFQAEAGPYGSSSLADNTHDFGAALAGTRHMEIPVCPPTPARLFAQVAALRAASAGRSGG